jgi:hypothetical protein
MNHADTTTERRTAFSRRGVAHPARGQSGCAALPLDHADARSTTTSSFAERPKDVARRIIRRPKDFVDFSCCDGTVASGGNAFAFDEAFPELSLDHSDFVGVLRVKDSARLLTCLGGLALWAEISGELVVSISPLVFLLLPKDGRRMMDENVED